MPAPGNEWEFLQSVLMRLYNRVVRDDFRDGIPDDTISTPESALRYACLIKDNDTAPMALCRMFLYFLVRGRGLEEPSIPMIWELKKGTYKLRDQSQLLVQWGPVSGTKRYSRWKMYIPHPKDGIRDNYNFRFPQFTKGNVTCTLTLRDGSSVVLNANSKAEGRKVLNYCETLIDSRYLIPGSQPVYTENSNRNLKVIRVEAKLVKKFDEDLDTIPKWIKRL